MSNPFEIPLGSRQEPVYAPVFLAPDLAPLLCELARALSQEGAALAMDEQACCLNIQTAAGVWRFDATPGRRLQSYCTSDDKTLSHYRLYDFALTFANLVLLAQVAAAACPGGGAAREAARQGLVDALTRR